MLVEMMNHAFTLPTYATEQSAGLDLHAAVVEDVVIPERGGTCVVPTGLKIVLPEGHEGQIRPRSGLAARHAVTVLNAPGTIDEDFRGEVKVLLINHGPEPYVVHRGARIAQLVVARYKHAYVFQVGDVCEENPTQRGSGGFGSTGV
jgi:dUTP pyrophosphatase